MCLVSFTRKMFPSLPGLVAATDCTQRNRNCYTPGGHPQYAPRVREADTTAHLSANNLQLLQALAQFAVQLCHTGRCIRISKDRDKVFECVQLLEAVLQFVVSAESCRNTFAQQGE